ncbi:sugar phosphate isomerase/epimerase [Aeoliella sp. ICT_H6.2]|uniref:Sugar phosphate isomerase/epimerase n=1 Tax=Aeoliella straminimaris TaxID=2954799 RepID=A0A9X2JI83_9BACT|nr:sugar phosphate isomerase/epimerase family protein [Aeoliella straminimaris]MCO6045418.1 sugar phosphate isomerase/epimerase [Aeoliella straminimaris]
MPLDCNFSVNELTTYRWTFDEDLYYAQKAGFDSIGLWRRKVNDFGEARAREMLDDSDLTVSSLSWAGGFTGGDGRTLDESIRDALAAVGAAERLQADCLVVLAGGQNSHIRPHRNRLFRQGLDEMLMAAEVAGVTLAIKPMHASCAREWTFLNSLEDALELLGQYQSPHVKLVYDLYHFPELADDPALVADLVPHLALVQLGDARVAQTAAQERCPLGHGVLPIWETVAALQFAGYNGCFDVELMGAEIEVADYQTLLAETYQSLVAGVDAVRQDEHRPLAERSR